MGVVGQADEPRLRRVSCSREGNPYLSTARPGLAHSHLVLAHIDKGMRLPRLVGIVIVKCDGERLHSDTRYQLIGETAELLCFHLNIQSKTCSRPVSINSLAMQNNNEISIQMYPEGLRSPVLQPHSITKKLLQKI